MRAVLGERPLTIRLLDLGADKCPSYLQLPREDNPQLGIRGVRALLRMPDLLQRHLSSVLRTSSAGPVRVLLPFVSTLTELDRVLDAIQTTCSREHISRESFQVGLMVEVPAVALGVAPFLERVDFLSVGTNDLVQYIFAASREDGDLEEYRMVAHPVILEMIRAVASAARARGKPVSVCGEVASDPALAPLLVGLGVSSLSVHPGALGRVRQSIRNSSGAALEAIAGQALGAASAAEVLALLGKSDPR
jgi:phosphoenolpyruvate-protein kinase (PTS system EI component)